MQLLHAPSDSPGTSLLRLFHHPRTRPILRALLFTYVILQMCPIRHWPLHYDSDNTWVFATNYGSAHGLMVGKDIIFTVGPLGWLVFPMAINGNLTPAHVFQVAVWLVLSGIFAWLFFRSGFGLRNLATFTGFLALASPLFWFNRLGMENQMLVAFLVLLVLVRFRGGTAQYIVALVLLGVIPLIKLSGGFVGGSALAGFLVDRVIWLRWRAWRSIVLAALIPVSAAGIGFYLAQHFSWAAVTGFLKGSAEISANYSIAVSLPGSPMDFLAAAETILLLGALLLLLALTDRRAAGFCAVLLAGPVFMSLKHGFMRQDYHISNFFCFAALAMSVVSLMLLIRGWRVWALFLIFTPFLVIWQDFIMTWGPPAIIAEVTGVRTLLMVGDVIRGNLASRLTNTAQSNYPSEFRIEPDIRALVGDAPVTSFSVVYGDLYMANMNLRLYPVIQKYSAYTPYLDQLNAAWIRDEGPRFLLFDGNTIDGRHAWVETPATWLEVYRWYSTKALGRRNLLLERRSSPRFTGFKVLQHVQGSLADDLIFPASEQPVFWTKSCALNSKGTLLKFIFRLPPSTMSFTGGSGAGVAWRIIPEVFSAPVMGNYLPSNLKEMAAVFTENVIPEYTHSKVSFGGSGLSFYGRNCTVELMQPVK